MLALTSQGELGPRKMGARNWWLAISKYYPHPTEPCLGYGYRAGIHTRASGQFTSAPS